MIVHSEEELLKELKRQETLYGRLAELYHWGGKFWLVASIWFFIATGAILVNQTRAWLLCSIAGSFFGLIGAIIGWRAKRIEKKEGLA